MASGDVVGVILGVMPPQSSGATPDVLPGGSTPAESIPVWDFDASADEYLDFLVALEGYDGGGLTVKLPSSASSATTGNGEWEAAIRRIQSDAEDLNSAHTYDYNGSGAFTVPSAVGEVVYPTLTFTDGADMDSLADGEMAVLRVRRNTGVASNATGDLELHGVVVKES